MLIKHSLPRRKDKTIVDRVKLSAIPVYVLLALSVSFLASATGQLSLGHAGLFGLGAFGAAIATSSWELPPLLGFLAGPVLAGGAAAALGAASLRVRGLSLAVRADDRRFGKECVSTCN